VRPLSYARKTILLSATLFPPAAWVVSATGGRAGWERVAWKRNCQWLKDHGYLIPSSFGDWYLTARGGLVANRPVRDIWRGWEISYDPPPIPDRSMDWTATGPGYDCDGDSEGFHSNGQIVRAHSREALLREIENWIEENKEEAA
jgi:hypothetical protein